ncbi:methyl-accepting chemotaxis protein, partial [Acaryochloris marina NIES-2412]
MKITQQIRLTIGALAAIGIGAAVIELFAIQRPVQDARVLKEVGLVRGNAEHAVELVLTKQQSAEEIKKIDSNINALIEGSPELKLPKADGEFLESMQEVQEKWTQLKGDLAAFQQDSSARDAIIKDNEIFFEIITEAVDVAEARFQEEINQEQLIILGILICELFLVFFAFVVTQRATKVLQSAANEVAGSSSQIAATVEEQGRIVSDQTASVNETTATVEELGASSMQAAQQANASAT